MGCEATHPRRSEDAPRRGPAGCAAGDARLRQPLAAVAAGRCWTTRERVRARYTGGRWERGGARLPPGRINHGPTPRLCHSRSAAECTLPRSHRRGGATSRDAMRLRPSRACGPHGSSGAARGSIAAASSGSANAPLTLTGRQGATEYTGTHASCDFPYNAACARSVCALPALLGSGKPPPLATHGNQRCIVAQPTGCPAPTARVAITWRCSFASMPSSRLPYGTYSGSARSPSPRRSSARGYAAAGPIPQSLSTTPRW